MHIRTCVRMRAGAFARVQKGIREDVSASARGTSQQLTSQDSLQFPLYHGVKSVCSFASRHEVCSFLRFAPV